MTKHEILECARDAGLLALMRNTGSKNGTVEKFARLMMALEREACIDIVAFHGGGIEIEAFIRARSDTQ